VPSGDGEPGEPDEPAEESLDASPDGALGSAEGEGLASSVAVLPVVLPVGSPVDSPVGVSVGVVDASGDELDVVGVGLVVVPEPEADGASVGEGEGEVSSSPAWDSRATSWDADGCDGAACAGWTRTIGVVTTAVAVSAATPLAMARVFGMVVDEQAPTADCEPRDLLASLPRKACTSGALTDAR
jgi:hypothetical protein